MAHNLHDKNGLYIVGTDLHLGYNPIPPPGEPFVPYLELTGVHPFSMGSNFHPTVKFNGGTPSVTDQHVSKFLWPHIPMVPNPLNPLFPIDVASGSQKTWLPRLQVLINGTPAAPTVFPGSSSINVNCWMFGFLPTNFVHQAGTVQTTPTGADYAYGAIRWAVDLAISVVLFIALLPAKEADVPATEEEAVEQAIMQQLLSLPTTKASIAATVYKAASSATGVDPGQGVASVIVGGPGTSVSFSASNAASAASSVSPVIGEGYSATNVGANHH